MLIKVIEDVNDIKKVLCHPDIYGCINDDDCCNSEDFEPPIIDEITYVAGYVDGDIIGLMIYHTKKAGLKCHIQVLPEYRNQHARQFARMALDLGKAKNVLIYSHIPVCYPNVISFAKEFGFAETGRIKDDYIKNNVKHDVIIMRA